MFSKFSKKFEKNILTIHIYNVHNNKISLQLREASVCVSCIQKNIFKIILNALFPHY